VADDETPEDAEFAFDYIELVGESEIKDVYFCSIFLHSTLISLSKGMLLSIWTPTSLNQFSPTLVSLLAVMLKLLFIFFPIQIAWNLAGLAFTWLVSR
jgi:hypothetical protein